MKLKKKKNIKIRLKDTTRNIKKIPKEDNETLNKDVDNTMTMKLPRVEFSLKSVPKVCSWCNTLYSIEDWDVNENKRTGVSHGICPNCFEKMEGDLKDE